MFLNASRLRDRLAVRRSRRIAHADLMRLDDHQLEDIGFNRADVDIRYG